MWFKLPLVNCRILLLFAAFVGMLSFVQMTIQTAVLLIEDSYQFLRVVLIERAHLKGRRQLNARESVVAVTTLILLSNWILHQNLNRNYQMRLFWQNLLAVPRCSLICFCIIIIILKSILFLFYFLF